MEWEQTYSLQVGDYLHLTPQFTVLASARFDHFHRNYQMSYSNDKEITSKDPKTSEHNNALTYGLSALYEFSDNINVYASASSFFKPTRTAVSDGYIYNARQLLQKEDLSGKAFAEYVALGTWREYAAAEEFCDMLKKRGAHVVSDIQRVASPQWNTDYWIGTVSPSI